MRETALQRTLRYMPLIFMVLVTAMVLALVAEQARRGLDGLPGMVIYSLTAGFGLEFVTAVWTRGGRASGSERELRR